MKYTVSVTRDITEEYIVHVEAKDKDEAMDLAYDFANSELATWETTDWVGESYAQVMDTADS